MLASGYGGICIEYVSLNKKINVVLTYMWDMIVYGWDTELDMLGIEAYFSLLKKGSLYVKEQDLVF